MLINKTVILSYVIVFLLGILVSKTFLEKGCPEFKQSKNIITVNEKTDTSVTKKEIEFKVPAKIKKKSDLPIVSHPIQDTGVLNSGPSITDNYIACFDSSFEGGFEAHVCYDTELKFFHNRFVLPEKTISKEKETTTDQKIEIIKTELPTYMIGFGVKAFLKDNTINTMPFLSLTANRKLWFLIASVEVKALTRINDGSLNMEPEIEGKIYVPL